MSSDPESISSGMHLPSWMRSRVEKHNFDDIQFSPPSHDESFFVIRYPVKGTTSSSATTTSDNNNVRRLTEIFHNNSSDNRFRQIDFSKHTEPCKKFLKESPNLPTEEIKNPPKSFGIDDGFKGPGAACGSSIVKVAQQMVSNRSLTTRGFKVATFNQPSPDPDNAFQTKTVEDQQLQASKPIQPQSQLILDHINEISSSTSTAHTQHNNQEQYNEQQDSILQSTHNRLMYRRGSKSLPSSPLGSPKSMRKYHPNPYFTTTSLFSSNNSSSADGRGWFLSSLLGMQRDATSTSSMTHIEEEAHDLLHKNANNNNYSNNKTTDQKVLRAKPSELREMNFWSPTSM